MASTNKTTNYELSQFVSSDIPAWLTDYNGDMSKIDAGIHAAKEQAAGAASGVSILQTTVSGKQDTLTFDTAPVAGSTNPVTSGGIYTALQNAQIQTDAVPTEGSTKAVQSGGVYTALQGKQNTLEFDSAPTQGSTNPVTSGGVYTALQSAGVTPQFLTVVGSGSEGGGIVGYAIKIGRLVLVVVSGYHSSTGTDRGYIRVQNVTFASAPAAQYLQSSGSVIGVREITPTSFSYISGNNSVRIDVGEVGAGVAINGVIAFTAES